MARVKKSDMFVYCFHTCLCLCTRQYILVYISLSGALTSRLREVVLKIYDCSAWYMEKNVIWPSCQTQTISLSGYTEILNTTGCGTWTAFGSEILLINHMWRYGCERRGGQFEFSSTWCPSHCDMSHTDEAVATIPCGLHEMPLLTFVLDSLAVLLLIIHLIYCMLTDGSSR